MQRTETDANVSVLSDRFSESSEIPLRTIRVYNDNPVWIYISNFALNIADHTDTQWTATAQCTGISRDNELELKPTSGQTYCLCWRHEDHSYRFRMTVHADNESSKEWYDIFILDRDIGASFCAFQAFILAAREKTRAKSKRESDKVNIRHYSCSAWKLSPWAFPKRDCDMFVSDESDKVKHFVHDVVAKFVKSEHEYNEHNVPFKACYLICGPPGSGKSTIIHLAASAIDYDICYLSAPDLTSNLSKMMASLPDKGCILVLEDIDVLCTRSLTEQSAQACMSSLTNAIDGTAYKPGLIIIMTSCHQGRLDATLLRPSRVDHVLQLAGLSEYQVKRFTARVYGEESGRHVAKRIWDVVSSMDDVTTSCISQFLFKHRHMAPADVTTAFIREHVLEKNKLAVDGQHALYS